MKKTIINIKNGIAPKDLQQALRTHQYLILEGKELKFEFSDGALLIYKQQEILNQSHIPNEIEGVELSVGEKLSLLDGETISLGASLVRIKDGALEIDKGTIQQQQLKL